MTGLFVSGLVLMFLLYGPIPTVLVRSCNFIRFRKRTKNGRTVAFTFDDGPHPQYTPMLLDLLKEHHVQASFFVVGEKAARYPEIIERIHREGHLIGIHNEKHQSNWLLTPWQVRKQVRTTADTIERITGLRPVYYRPPWGMLNLFDFTLRQHCRIVLWSLLTYDWSRKTGSESIKNKLLTGITDGSVILLHDCGSTPGADHDAPEQMLSALQQVLPQILSKGFVPVRIDEMIKAPGRLSPGRLALSYPKRLLVSVWMKWERLFDKCFHLQPIDPSNPLLKVRVRTYRGQTIRFENGEEIHTGDRVAELHLNNEILFKYGAHARSPLQLAIRLVRLTEQVMPKAAQLLKHPRFQDVKGFYGISLINRGPDQFGFRILDLPKGVFTFATRIYLKILLYVMHPQGKQRIQTKKELLIPKLIVISTKELREKYSKMG
ncbi:polysaccharide deacetylase family protein [Effusibacillus dendaii]|uniref:NodB homology domain-containing protein n=1 Tax=Effusibacillus dendaii TaxID=2743772 RepID=A0A7I8DFR6_9BACL|nr:polysaccharide deacetylase family protein [Effusibacillus dendaii]BCJ87779.1 hypothetical protein skT53_27640 [Effusibacillus dendaii]